MNKSNLSNYVSLSKKGNFGIIRDISNDLSNGMGIMEVSQKYNVSTDDVISIIDVSCYQQYLNNSDPLKYIYDKYHLFKSGGNAFSKIGSSLKKASSSAKQFSDKAKKTLSDKAKKAKQVLSDKAKQAKKQLSDKAKETKKQLSDKAKQAKKQLSDKAKETKKVLSEKSQKMFDEVKKQVIFEMLNEMKKNVDLFISDDNELQIDNIKNTIQKTNFSDKFKKLLISKIEENEETINKFLNETKLKSLIENKKKEEIKKSVVQFYNENKEDFKEVIKKYLIQKGNNTLKHSSEKK